MEKCKFTLNFENKELTFNSQLELNNFLKENYDILTAGRELYDIEYSKVMGEGETPAQKTFTKLMNIAAKGPEITVKMGDMAEKEITSKTRGYKSVLTQLKELAKIGNTPGLIYFDEDRYINNRRDYIIKQLQLNNPEGVEDFDRLALEYSKLKSEVTRKLIPEEEFDKKLITLVTTSIQTDLENWAKLAGIGTNLHKLAQVFFEHKLKNDGSIFSVSSFPANIVDLEYNGRINYLKFLEQLDGVLQEKHGVDCKILPEYKIYDEKSKLVGVIDLLVIDSEGKVHVYDYKASYKDPYEWNSGKITTFRYQLGLYANMLKNKGINVKTMAIIPLTMNDIDFDRQTLPSVTSHGIATIRETDFNPQMRYNMNHIVAVDNASFYESQTASTNVTEQLTAAWGYNLKMKTSKSNVDDFLKNNVKEDFKDKSKVVFFDVSAGKHISTTPEKVREEVEAYFKRESESATSLLISFKDQINDIIHGKKSFAEFSIGNRVEDLHRREVLTRAFGKYVGGDWELVMDDGTLDNLGLLMFINTNTNVVEFVSYTVNNLNTQMVLKGNKSIMGNFVSDAIAESEPNILPATNGNIELLKAFFYVNDNIDLFESRGYSLGRIMTFNPISNKSHTQNLERLRFNFDYLSTKMKLENKTINLKAGDKYLLLLNRLTSLMKEDSISDTTRDQVTRFVTVFTDKKDSGRLSALLQLEQELRDIFIERGGVNSIKTFHTPEEKLYGMVNDAILYERKIPLTFEKDLSEFITNSSNPTSMPSKNLLAIVEITKEAMQRIRQKHLDFKNDSAPIIDSFLDNQGFNKARRRTIGDQAKAYNNLFILDSKNNIDSRMILKDPYDKDSDLSPEERQFSIYFLKEINRLRYGTTDLMSEVAIQKRESLEWFAVPLLRASQVSKMITQGTRGSIKEYLNDIVNLNNIFDSEGEQLDKYSAGMFEMFNTFEFHGTQDGRNALIQEEKQGAFESNLEIILDTFNFAYNRQAEYNKILPVVNAIKVAMSWQAYELNIEIPNMEKFIEKYIKSAVYSDLDIAPGTKMLRQAAGVLKDVTSMVNIGANPIVGALAIFQGQWGNITRLMSRSYGENMFEKKHYFAALSFMVKDCTESIDSLSVAEELNMLYGLNNMDVNRLPEQMTKNRGGLLGFRSGGLYWFSSAPDYYNRMVIFTAQMMKDGCFEAHSMVDGKLVYNFKADKRFSIFAAGDTKNPEYGKQRSLYKVMRAEFNNSGHNILEGEDLPIAYTLKQRESMKMFSDSIHGYYDHETKIMYNNTLLGMMFLQFKRWLTSKKDQYLLATGTYAQGEYEQLEISGVKYYVDKEGNQTTEDTGEPLMIWKGKVMEGILVSFAHMFKEIQNSENKIETFWKLLKDRPVRTANMKLFVWDMGIVLALMLLGGLIDWPELKKDNAYLEALLRAIRRSGDDLNLLSVMGAGLSPEPFAALGYAKDVKDSFFRTMSGDMSIGKAITSNIGFARPFSGMFPNTEEGGSTGGGGAGGSW